jgi:SAM-dependent methyltransferase
MHRPAANWPADLYDAIDTVEYPISVHHGELPPSWGAVCFAAHVRIQKSSILQMEASRIYAKHYETLLDSDLHQIDYMMPAENLVRIIKIFNLHRKGSPSSTALDVGCGDGRHSFYLSQLGYTVTATDCTREAVDLTKRRLANVSDSRVLLADESVLSSELIMYAPFKIVICWETLHWFGSQNSVKGFLEGVGTLLASDGIFIFTLVAENDYRIEGAVQSDDDRSLVLACNERSGATMYVDTRDAYLKLIEDCGLSTCSVFRYSHGREHISSQEEVSDDLTFSQGKDFSMYAFVCKKQP